MKTQTCKNNLVYFKIKIYPLHIDRNNIFFMKEVTVSKRVCSERSDFILHFCKSQMSGLVEDS